MEGFSVEFYVIYGKRLGNRWYKWVSLFFEGYFDWYVLRGFVYYLKIRDLL